MVWLMETVKRDPRGQGDQGERSAMLWLGARGAGVFMPVFHSPDFDLIADWGAGLVRVQVKTSNCFRNGRWDVTVCTRGGNQSWNGLIKYLDPNRYDYLFVLVGDGRRWFIPAADIDATCGLRLGGPPKYARYEIEPGEPIRPRAADARLSDPLAGFPSGQRDQTVNLAAKPSQVRILPPPSPPRLGQQPTDAASKCHDPQSSRGSRSHDGHDHQHQPAHQPSTASHNPSHATSRD
jgi:hypothetical protein